MDRILRARPSPAMVVALIALFVALSGTSYAIRTLNVNAEKVDGLNAVKSKVTTKRAAGKLVATEPKGTNKGNFSNKFLPKVDEAVNADTATNASNADMLDNLDSADFLRSNAKAADADLLDGMNSTAFLGSSATAGGDLTGNYPSPDIAANAVGAGEVANGSLGTVELESSIPAVHVTHSAGQSINNNAFNTLAFDQERYDTAGMHDTATNNSRLTAPVTGIYAVTAQVNWTSNATGFRELALRKNGATQIALEQSTPGTPGTAAQELTTQVRLAAGDYVEARVFQNSGLSQDAFTANEYTPEFSMTWLAPGP